MRFGTAHNRLAHQLHLLGNDSFVYFPQKGRPMSYKQVHEILDQSRTLHEDLGDYYEAVRQTSEDERLNFLLNSIRQRDEYVETLLEGYDPKEREGLLNYYFQFAPDQQISQELRSAKIERSMTVDEVIEVVLTYERGIEALYRQFAESANSPRVQEFFGSLASAKEFQGRMFSWDVLEHDQSQTIPERN